MYNLTKGEHTTIEVSPHHSGGFTSKIVKGNGINGELRDIKLIGYSAYGHDFEWFCPYCGIKCYNDFHRMSVCEHFEKWINQESKKYNSLVEK